MRRVPLVDLAAQEAEVAPEILAEIAALAAEGRFVLGGRVEAFERWLAEAVGAAHAVGLASGTDALELALRALGIGAGDAVITPAVSFIAAAEAIAAVGARPVFCDVDPVTTNADAGTMSAALGRARRAGLRVRALLPVHLFGRCAPGAALRDLATGEGIALVEDAAQALGARDAAQALGARDAAPGEGEAAPGEGEAARRATVAAGAWGDASCFSFFPTKALGAWGDGGAVVTSRADVAARVRALGAHGAVAAYVHAEIGRNSRLDTLQAAVLRVKARRLALWHTRRSEWARRYGEAFRAIDRGALLVPEAAPEPAVHAWHAYVVRSPRRDALAAHLRERGIEARVYYPVPLHRQPVFASLDEPPLPQAEAACRTALALPIGAVPPGDAQAYVIDEVLRFFAGR